MLVQGKPRPWTRSEARPHGRCCAAWSSLLDVLDVLDVLGRAVPLLWDTYIGEGARARFSVDT